MSLAALVVARYSRPDILLTYSNPAVTTPLKDDAKLIVSKAKFLKSKLGERDKLACDYGVWFVTRGEEDLLFAACVQEDYPERVAFGLIQKVQAMVSERDKRDSVEQRVGKLQKEIKAVCERYKDSRNDKVREAQAAVGELKEELHRGVRKMLDNQENLVELNDKAALMKSTAQLM